MRRRRQRDGAQRVFVPTHTEREHVSSNGGEFKSRHALCATRPGENALCVQREGRRDQNQMRRPAAKGDIPRAAHCSAAKSQGKKLISHFNWIHPRCELRCFIDSANLLWQIWSEQEHGAAYKIYRKMLLKGKFGWVFIWIKPAGYLKHMFFLPIIATKYTKIKIFHQI